MAETQIEKYMRLLDCTEEQAKDIIATDEIIDKGGRTHYDLDPEKEKMAKKFANVTSHKKPTAYKFTTRERKADVEKEEIISKIEEEEKAIEEYKKLIEIHKQKINDKIQSIWGNE